MKMKGGPLQIWSLSEQEPVFLQEAMDSQFVVPVHHSFLLSLQAGRTTVWSEKGERCNTYEDTERPIDCFHSFGTSCISFSIGPKQRIIGREMASGVEVVTGNLGEGNCMCCPSLVRTDSSDVRQLRVFRKHSLQLYR